MDDAFGELSTFLKVQLAGTIDFKGQAIYDKYSSALIYGGIALSVVLGFVFQDFQLLLKTLGATYVASLIFALPIPAYRRNPVKWLEPAPAPTAKGIEVDFK